jgi:hypothetical protein
MLFCFKNYSLNDIKDSYECIAENYLGMEFLKFELCKKSREKNQIEINSLNQSYFINKTIFELTYDRQNVLNNAYKLIINNSYKYFLFLIIYTLIC